MGVHARGAPDRGEPLNPGSDIDWRARAEALEAELAARSARANEALAEAQRRTYWLDRLHLDLNALMARPASRRLIALLPVAREAYRTRFHAREWARRLRRWLREARTEAARDATRAERLSGRGRGAAAAELAGGSPGRVLLLAQLSDLRSLWHDAASGSDAHGEFDLVVVDDAAGGLAAAESRLAGGGRVLLDTTQPAEAVVDTTAFGWALLGRRQLADGRDLYLLRRS